MPETKQDELIHQITQAWERAKAQLEQLRQDVVRTSQMAQLQMGSGFLSQDKDKVLKRLGEGVWEQVRKGKLTLPASLAGAVKELEVLEEKAKKHAGEIADILQEGDEAARRKHGSMKSAVAGKNKKR